MSRVSVDTDALEELVTKYMGYCHKIDGEWGHGPEELEADLSLVTYLDIR